MAQQNILITGACGFVGEFVVREFLERSDYILHLNCRKGHTQETSPRIFLHRTDLSSAEQLKELFSKNRFHAVIHLSALARLKEGESHPEEAYRVNFLNTKLLLRTAEHFRVQKFVFISSDLARNHKSVVGMTKFLSEADLMLSKRKSTQRVILRLPNIEWTPGSVHLIFRRLLDDHQPITITHPEMTRRFISRTEAAAYIRCALELGNDKDLFVVNKPVVRITDLARQMMQERGMNVALKYIGRQPGEKLAEEAYKTVDIKSVDKGDLALLIHSIPWERDRESVNKDLQEKLKEVNTEIKF